MSNRTDETYQVAIAGGGPVGLFLACCLYESGISCVIFEKRLNPIAHSRSIGIQPVSLELFEKTGLAKTFIDEGIKVQEGRAFCHEKPIGRISFRSCPPPYPFILTLPQHRTEKILARHLCDLDESILQRGTKVTAVEESNHYVQLQIDRQGQKKRVQAKFVVGCDGKKSFIRQAAGIDFTGKIYDDTYIMGDFTDNTSLGCAAGIFLCRQGVIESFPLSEQKRRWVVKTATYQPKIIREDIERRIQQRINHDLRGTENFMLSSFGVQKKFAKTMNKNRILLAGDAAHVISPIGGQGMNLGWLDAWDLSQVLQKKLADGKPGRNQFEAYSRRRLKIAGKAARRAEFNMMMGRETNFLIAKKYFLRGLLKSPASYLLARLFTMRGLKRYVF
ncbi:MAG TPA: NAD(P)/FAD-dependent oxidoreductase [Balneolaceae bacterium]|nr:NAD(P)/FAD-dependent oxidoreductase [Balneolaceae bacterium]